MFPSLRYEEYSNGNLISSGKCSARIIIEPAGKGSINCIIENNGIEDRLMSNFSFDACITLHDRLLMLSNPEHTNAQIPVGGMLSMFVGYNRVEKFYDSLEPVVGSIYIDGNDVVKISFTLSNPERLIEFY